VSNFHYDERQMRIHSNTSTKRQRVSAETHLLALRAGISSSADRQVTYRQKENNVLRRILIIAMLLSAVTHAALYAAQEAPGQPRRKANPRADREAIRARQLAGADVHVFKAIGDVKLRLFAFKPRGHKQTDKRPAIVFFFGGGWTNGSPGQFAPHCQYLATRGMVAITAEYRIRSKHGVTVPQCVADAKSAVRWIRTNAGKLGVDPDRIAAGGGSAGGHLGACVGVVPGLDEKSEDQSVSSRPNAMVLFNPVMATASADELSQEYKQGMERRREQFGGDPKVVSPLHHIQEDQPPMIMFFGSADRLLESAELFDKAYRAADNRCELKIWDGPGHGFFNFGRGDNKYFIETCRDMDQFLVSLGYLDGEATVKSFVKECTTPVRH